MNRIFTCVTGICSAQDKLPKLINFNFKSKLERYSSTHNDTSLKDRVFFSSIEKLPLKFKATHRLSKKSFDWKYHR